MGNFMIGHTRQPDLKRKLVGTLDSIAAHISTEATEPEMFALKVAREVLAGANDSQIAEAVKKAARAPGFFV